MVGRRVLVERRLLSPVALVEERGLRLQLVEVPGTSLLRPEDVVAETLGKACPVPVAKSVVVDQRQWTIDLVLAVVVEDPVSRTHPELAKSRGSSEVLVRFAEGQLESVHERIPVRMQRLVAGPCELVLVPVERTSGQTLSGESDALFVGGEVLGGCLERGEAPREEVTKAPGTLAIEWVRRTRTYEWRRGTLLLGCLPLPQQQVRQLALLTFGMKALLQQTPLELLPLIGRLLRRCLLLLEHGHHHIT